MNGVEPDQQPAARRAFLAALARPGRYAVLRDACWIVIGRIGTVSVREASLAQSDGEQLLETGTLRRCGAGIEITPKGRTLVGAVAAPVQPVADDEDEIGALPAVNPNESPLAWLRSRRDRNGRPLVDDAGFLAGERLRADLALSGMLPRVTADWTMTAGGSAWRGGLLPSEVMMSARQRVDRARKAVGAEFAGVLIDFCGFLKGLECLERERGWPPRAAKVVVLMALAALARHYGLQNVATGLHRPRPPARTLPDNVVPLLRR